MTDDETRTNEPKMALRVDFANQAGYVYLKAEGYDGIQAALDFVRGSIDAPKGTHHEPSD